MTTPPGIVDIPPGGTISAKKITSPGGKTPIGTVFCLDFPRTWDHESTAVANFRARCRALGTNDECFRWKLPPERQKKGGNRRAFSCDGTAFLRIKVERNKVELRLQSCFRAQFMATSRHSDDSVAKRILCEEYGRGQKAGQLWSAESNRTEPGKSFWCRLIWLLFHNQRVWAGKLQWCQTAGVWIQNSTCCLVTMCACRARSRSFICALYSSAIRGSSPFCFKIAGNNHRTVQQEWMDRSDLNFRAFHAIKTNHRCYKGVGYDKENKNRATRFKEAGVPTWETEQTNSTLFQIGAMPMCLRTVTAGQCILRLPVHTRNINFITFGTDRL